MTMLLRRGRPVVNLGENRILVYQLDEVAEGWPQLRHTLLVSHQRVSPSVVAFGFFLPINSDAIDRILPVTIHLCFAIRVQRVELSDQSVEASVSVQGVVNEPASQFQVLFAELQHETTLDQVLVKSTPVSEGFVGQGRPILVNGRQQGTACVTGER